MNLCLMAHPDDETLACGGLIARDPTNWHVAVLADGVTSRGTDGRAVRHEHFIKAMETLGVTSFESHGLPDQRLDTLDFLDLTIGVSQIIDRVNPTAVYTHFRADLNRDHRLVCEAVHVACRPPKWIAIYECEVPSSTEWGIGEPFRPNVFVDIGQTLPCKASAFECYVDEVRESPHPRSIPGLHDRAGYWGMIAGMRWAEPFMLVREVR